MTTEPIEIAKWIEDEQIPRTGDGLKGGGVTIGHCIPPKFESYCKIYHPFEVTTDEPDILEPHEEYRKRVSFTITNSLMIDIFAQQEERLKEYKSKKWDFVTWKSIAEKYGLIFHNEINPKTYTTKFQKIGWPKNLSFPREGYLPRPLLVNLLNILSNINKLNEIYIYQIIPNNIWKDNKHCDLVKCRFDEVLEYFEDDFIGYLYAIDKSWVVFTDTDLHFTIVGGHKRLIEVLLASDLEVLECNATTRVDEYSDKINLENNNIKYTWWQKLLLLRK